jgi:hypothetical protein
MMFTDEILSAATALRGGDAEGIRPLCAAAERDLARRLKRGISPEDCRDEFIAAAAFMAVAMYLGVEPGGYAYRAGDLSVAGKSPEKSAGLSERLYRQALAMMAGNIDDSGFYFAGVPGL